MSKSKGYLDEIQAHCDEDMFKEMLRVMAQVVMEEIKRRTRVVGIFPNQASADRLVGAHLLERHERWACEPARYLNMDWIETDGPNRGGQKGKAA